MAGSRPAFLWFGLVVGSVMSADAEVIIETVRVGNPGNTGELSGEGAGGDGEDRICGAVDYVFDIGKFEVTADQYTEFLNAVADDDTYGLYNMDMLRDFGDIHGCKIIRTGDSPDHTYSVAPDWADRPVNFVSWGDAARFCNWLHNGQPTGAQDLTTTEEGSYFLSGATNDAALAAVIREPDATWVIPSEDEWYKAAYHYNDGATGNYFDYPTSTNDIPSNDLIDPDPGNNANFHDNGDTIGRPYYRTVVGNFENSESPYDTFDQGGNVWEWNEALIGLYRFVRGGSFAFYNDYVLRAENRYKYEPTSEASYVGFRVALICRDRGTMHAHQSFVECLTGPGTLVAGTCICSDLDDDRGVDLYDFAVFQTDFTGSE